MPTFYGITFNYLIPLKESDYGYLPGNAYSGIASLLFPTKFKNNWYPKGLSLGFIYMKTEASFWGMDEAPNSEAEMYLPAIGLIWNHKKYGSFSLNMRYNQNEAIPEDANDNKSTSCLYKSGVKIRAGGNDFSVWEVVIVLHFYVQDWRGGNPGNRLPKKL